jgi:ribosome-binding factor A
MDSTRQQKISRQIQRDIAEILQKELADTLRGTLVTVTTVRVSPDLAYAKLYLSIFPFERSEQTLDLIKEKSWYVRKLLGARIRNQLKIVPELEWFIDDSLEYIENIDNLLNK